MQNIILLLVNLTEENIVLEKEKSIFIINRKSSSEVDDLHLSIKRQKPF